MSWTVEYDATLQIIVDTYVGKCSGQDFRDVAKKRIALAEEVQSTRTLIDASKLLVDSSTTMDVYNLVDEIYETEDSRVDWKLAITTPESPDAREQVQFFVNVCINRGWNVKEFSERKNAINWLLSS